MSNQLKTFYCDAQIVSTVTLQTKAKDEDEALDNFQNEKYIALDPLKWVCDPKAFLNIRTTPKISPWDIRKSFRTLENEMKGEGGE